MKGNIFPIFCLTGKSWNQKFIVPPVKFDFMCVPAVAQFVVTRSSNSSFERKLMTRKEGMRFDMSSWL